MSSEMAKIQKELEFIKNRLLEIEDKFDLLIDDKYEVKEEYVKKIKGILREGEFEEYETVDELRRSIEQ